MIKNYKYRLYPTDTQSQQLDWTLARCCELYNAALQERKDAWDACKQHPNFYDPQWRKEHAAEYSVNYYDQANALPELKREIRPEYRAVGAHVLQEVLRRVDKTFQAFFRRVRTGATPGYPRFKSRTHYDSFSFPDHAGWKLTGSRLSITGLGSEAPYAVANEAAATIRIPPATDTSYLAFAPAGGKEATLRVMPRKGSIKVKLHREIQGTIKTCMIKREGKCWYVVFACEVAACPLPLSYEDVGIDLGVTHFAALSDGTFIEQPRYYRRSEKKLASAQQTLARKKRGSHRRKKAVAHVARCHRKVRNQRRDFQHKASRSLVDQYQLLAFEKLQEKNMVRRPKPKKDEQGKYLPNGAAAKGGLNKSIHDAGWRQFVSMVSAKAASAGRTVMPVNPHKTSQICSACLEEGPHKDLSERTHTCVHCGVVLDRDHNAALNILRLGRSLQGTKVS